MTTLRAELVDPRYVTSEENKPTYRVDFWKYTRPDLVAQERGLATEEWRVSGARDVHEVIAWADEHSLGRRYVLSVEFHEERGVGLVRLSGRFPE